MWRKSKARVGRVCYLFYRCEHPAGMNSQYERVRLKAQRSLASEATALGVRTTESC